VKQGATTIWERWDGQKPDGSFQTVEMNSFNHYAYGAIGDWMYRVMAGIDVDEAAPGYKHILIQPRPGGGFTSVKASHETPYGKVASAWTIADGRFELSARGAAQHEGDGEAAAGAARERHGERKAADRRQRHRRQATGRRRGRGRGRLGSIPVLL
jgi:alpha-L-rhamnosidase